MDTYPELSLTLDPVLPLFRTVREFDHPTADVFRAHVDPELVCQWLGPRRLSTRIDHWDCRTGGSYRYSNLDEVGNEYRFFGSFHEIVPGSRIVQTFTFAGEPDTVALQRAEFVELDGDRTSLRVVFLTESVAARDGFLHSGMKEGAKESYERMDDLLRVGAARDRART